MHKNLMMPAQCGSSRLQMESRRASAGSVHFKSRHAGTAPIVKLLCFPLWCSFVAGVAWLFWSSWTDVSGITSARNSSIDLDLQLSEGPNASMIYAAPLAESFPVQYSVEGKHSTDRTKMADSPPPALIPVPSFFRTPLAESFPVQYSVEGKHSTDRTKMADSPPPALIPVPLFFRKAEHHNEGPYHDLRMFKEGLKQMRERLRIFVYPHSSKSSFSHVFSPISGEPRGNYASESYFKKALMSSAFLTKNPSEARLFFLPFSISRLRQDKRVGVSGLSRFISSYIASIRQKWPYWNRTSGADHFFVSCHSVTKLVSEDIADLRVNAIQVVCSSNSFMPGYVPHKDVPMPQVWPRKGAPSETKSVKQRKMLAFFAGTANSPVRQALVKAWAHDQDIVVHARRVAFPYSRALLTSKFCLHVKGYEVNTARIADAIHFGCVPVILADHYDLPFADVLRWDRFSVTVSTADIPLLKTILKAITAEEYTKLQRSVMEVRKHFQWSYPPLEYDAFHMVLYEVWSRSHFLKPIWLQ